MNPIGEAEVLSHFIKYFKIRGIYIGYVFLISCPILSIHSNHSVPVEYGPGIYQKTPPVINSQKITPSASLPLPSSTAIPVLPAQNSKAVIATTVVAEPLPEPQDNGFEEVLDIYTQVEEEPVNAAPKPIDITKTVEPVAKEEGEKKQPPLINKKGQRVGLLLPLSERHASLGQAFLGAAEIALFDAKNPHLQIIPLDTHGTPEGAKAAFEKGINQGVSLFLGPIFAPELEVIQDRARARHVNVIGFSNDQRLAKSGTYVLAFFPKAHIVRIIDFALEKEDHTIVLLAPSNKYGEIVEGAFKEHMQELGEKVHVLTYNPDQLGKLAPIIRKIKKIKPHFLLIPQGNPTLDRLLDQLSEQGLDLANYTILGGDQWCTSNAPKNPHVKQAFFAGPNAALQQEFNKKYESIYGKKPPLLASLIYDAVLLSATLGMMYPEKPFSHEHLTTSDGFVGLTGAFRFSPEGKAERQLEVIEIGAPN